ncbi:MAG: hypothetical protein LBC43_01390 [Bifidobacteriaceae bacterium]|jgi:hypothetical protein|nr:hypothetical protein [Bifidobacteriaceae bacterium]
MGNVFTKQAVLVGQPYDGVTNDNLSVLTVEEGLEIGLSETELMDLDKFYQDTIDGNYDFAEIDNHTRKLPHCPIAAAV